MPRPRKAIDLPPLNSTPERPPLFLERMLDPALPKTAQVYDMMRRAIVGLELRPFCKWWRVGEPQRDRLAWRE